MSEFLSAQQILQTKLKLVVEDREGSKFGGWQVVID